MTLNYRRGYCSRRKKRSGCGGSLAENLLESHSSHGEQSPGHHPWRQPILAIVCSVTCGLSASTVVPTQTCSMTLMKTCVPNLLWCGLSAKTAGLRVKRPKHGNGNCSKRGRPQECTTKPVCCCIVHPYMPVHADNFVTEMTWPFLIPV